ncbi:Metallo-dependent phosphatase-like protein [Chytriomyces sp. MP71]|nr:Metallo-dependent phosphatase-like protein [Chytriomyces sp. MP71]
MSGNRRLPQRSKMWYTICHFTLAFSVFSCASAAPKPLRFNEDGMFRMVQFTDLHYGENPDSDWGPIQDINSTIVMHKILDTEENVDLVVFTGDQMTGENFAANNASLYVKQMLEPTVLRSIPFASIYGNHDHSSAYFTAKDIYNAEKRHGGDLVRTQLGNISGYGNYYLPILPPIVMENGFTNKNQTTPAAILWFFDTHGRQGRNWIKSDQVAWFRAQSTRLCAQHGSIPSFAFFHIPVAAHREDNTRADFENICEGFRDEPGAIAIQDGDEGFAAALAGSSLPVLASFSGHDHGTGWCCEGPSGSGLETMQLCFGKHTGYGGYGSWDRGARVIELNAWRLPRWKTWIRMENATVVYPSEFHRR